MFSLKLAVICDKKIRDESYSLLSWQSMSWAKGSAADHPCEAGHLAVHIAEWSWPQSRIVGADLCRSWCAEISLHPGLVGLKTRGNLKSPPLFSKAPPRQFQPPKCKSAPSNPQFFCTITQTSPLLNIHFEGVTLHFGGWNCLGASL